MPFGTDLLFRARDVPGLVVAAEICEDMWVPQPPGIQAALAGATVIANLSASNITVGKARTRTLLCQSHSARCICAYLYAAAGRGNQPPTWRGTGKPPFLKMARFLHKVRVFHPAWSR